MRMIASFKLHKAQVASSNMIPYQKALRDMLIETICGQHENISTYLVPRDIKRVAIVAVSSNSSLCGAFNANVEKAVKGVMEEYKHLGKENIVLFPIGKKISKALTNSRLKVESADFTLSDKPNFAKCAEITGNLMNLFKEGSIDRVEVIYNHFKTSANQAVTRETLMPLVFANEIKRQTTDYILEPDKSTIIEDLIDKVLIYKIYAILLDSNASEHAARTVAMQLATENAKKLIQELTVQYNKTRQQAITNELLDIMGGASR
jgi:F-type H+-transporting ATPase subunit gamma